MLFPTFWITFKFSVLVAALLQSSAEQLNTNCLSPSHPWPWTPKIKPVSEDSAAFAEMHSVSWGTLEKKNKNAITMISFLSGVTQFLLIHRWMQEGNLRRNQPFVNSCLILLPQHSTMVPILPGSLKSYSLLPPWSKIQEHLHECGASFPFSLFLTNHCFRGAMRLENIYHVGNSIRLQLLPS